MFLKKIIPCSLVAILLSCSEVKLPDFDAYAEGQKEVLDLTSPDFNKLGKTIFFSF